MWCSVRLMLLLLYITSELTLAMKLGVNVSLLLAGGVVAPLLGVPSRTQRAVPAKFLADDVSHTTALNGQGLAHHRTATCDDL